MEPASGKRKQPDRAQEGKLCVTVPSLISLIIAHLARSSVNMSQLPAEMRTAVDELRKILPLTMPTCIPHYCYEAMASNTLLIEASFVVLNNLIMNGTSNTCVMNEFLEKLLFFSEGKVDAIRFLSHHVIPANRLGPLLAGALHRAAARGNWDIIQVLLERGVPIDQPHLLDTPLTRAVGHGRMDIVRRLLAAGANKNIVGCLGTAMYNARERNLQIIENSVTENDLVTIEQLLATPRDENEARKNEEFLREASLGNLDLVRRLLSEGAYIEAQDGNGNTALMLATYYGQKNVVEFLINYGVRDNARNHLNQNAHDIATAGHNGNRSMLDLLNPLRLWNPTRHL